LINSPVLCRESPDPFQIQFSRWCQTVFSHVCAFDA
jgi:hypothetical protein